MHFGEMFFGQAMDLNCLTWILAILTANQHRLSTMTPSIDSFASMRAALLNLSKLGTANEVAGGKGRQPIHS